MLTGLIYQTEHIPDNNVSRKPKIQRDNIWNIYRQAVNAYTCRNITWESDTVDEFQGMTELIRQGANTKFWFGIPAFTFDQALLWYPKGPPQRRSDRDGNKLFVSWSWVVWKDSCHYRSRGWHNGLYSCPILVVRWVRQMDPIRFLADNAENGYASLPEGMRREEA